MTRQQFESFESKLKEAGYKRYQGPITNNDFYFAKGFAYYYDEDGDRYPSYQIIYSVWDYTNYPIVPDNDKFGIEPRIMLHVSDQRTDLIFVREDCEIEEIESKAEKFFAFAQVYL